MLALSRTGAGSAVGADDWLSECCSEIDSDSEEACMSGDSEFGLMFSSVVIDLVCIDDYSLCDEEGCDAVYD